MLSVLAYFLCIDADFTVVSSCQKTFLLTLTQFRRVYDFGLFGRLPGHAPTCINILGSPCNYVIVVYRGMFAIENEVYSVYKLQGHSKDFCYIMGKMYFKDVALFQTY